MISERTKAALAAAQARGVKLGGHGGRLTAKDRRAGVEARQATAARIVYWDLVETPGAIDGDRIECPKCGTRERKADLQWTGEVAVQSHTSARSKRIDAHKPTRRELALIEDAAICERIVRHVRLLPPAESRIAKGEAASDASEVRLPARRFYSTDQMLQLIRGAANVAG
jgi:RNA polymerase subunit RPABC4/transcription elongation factor Spt4